MNYSIRKKVVKYYKSKESLLEYLNKLGKTKEITDSDKIQIIGLTNEVWQNWTHIFRTFWLTYYYGGETLIGKVNRNTISISNFSAEDDEATAFMKITKQSKNMFFYQEKTWGSKDALVKITNLYPSLGRSNIIASSLSLYGDYLNDFQKIRNSMVHLTESGFLDLKDHVLSRNYTSPKSYYPHNHPINFFYYKIGVSPNFVFEDVFEQFDLMLETIFISNPDI